MFLQELKQAIKEEVEREDHEQYSMFWLVLTGHGGEKDTLALRDGSTIKLSTVMEMLSARNFPAMKGKPKVIIWQACAGREFRCWFLTFKFCIDTAIILY